MISRVFLKSHGCFRSEFTILHMWDCLGFMVFQDKFVRGVVVRSGFTQAEVSQGW